MASKGLGTGAKLKRLPSVEVTSPYSRNAPELGHAAIVNTLKTELPRTVEEVLAVKQALETVGFTVKCYDDCTAQHMKNIKDKITKEEYHKESNCLFLILICNQMDQGWIPDKNRMRAFTLQDLTSSLDGISTLQGKPKIMVIQQFLVENKGSAGSIEHSQNRKDFYIIEATATRKSDPEMSFLKQFAVYLEKHHPTEDFDTILQKTSQEMLASIQVPSTLEDSELMTLARQISSSEMQIIAVEKLGIKMSEVKNLLATHRENQDMMNFELLSRWRNRNPEDSRKKLAEILCDTDGKIDPTMVKEVLKFEDNPLTTVNHVNTLSHQLHFSEFHKKSTLPETETEPETSSGSQGAQAGVSFKGRAAKLSGNSIEITLLRSFSVGREKCPEFAVMKNNDIVMSSRKTENNPKSILLISSQGSDVSERSIPAPCKHDVAYFFISLTGESVAVSCFQCQLIRVLKPKTGDLTQVNMERQWVGRLCLGGKNRIFVQAKKDEILELKLDSVAESVIDNTYHSRISNRYNGLCYVPSPPRLLIVTDNTRVLAIDCSKDSEAWTVSGKVDGKKIDPGSVVYSPNKNMIIVSDGVNSRLLVLQRKDGKHAQTVELDDVNVVDMRLRGDELAVLHSSDDEYNISYFSLK